MTAPVEVGPSPTIGGPTPALTPREAAVLVRVAAGATYVQLAREWGLSEISVRGYGARAMRKFEATTIAHAVMLACHAGILDGRPQRHGDHAGYVAHTRRGEVPCDACDAGERAYRAGLRANRRRAAVDVA